MAVLTSISIMGPAGAPMKQKYGSFAGKPAGPTFTEIFENFLFAAISRLGVIGRNP